MPDPETIIWLVPLLPLLGAAWIAVGYLLKFNRNESGERHTARTATAAAGLSFVVAAVIALNAVLTGNPGHIITGEWFASGQLHIDIVFVLDTLSLTVSVLVGFISLLMVRFSVNYLHREAGFQRMFLILLIFISAMQLIVLAGSSVLAFVGWEMAGLSSYLLIGYAWDRPVATANATTAFITNRIGDAGFILGITLSIIWLGGSEWSMLENTGELENLQIDLIVGCFLIAALAKSAQLPFSAWIARALEGPTPSSAIFYGSLMVHAGVYLLLRLEPLLSQAQPMMVLIAVLGLLTALYGWLAGLVQTDIKSSLMFSTTSQVGLMLLWIGMGWFDLAAWHLVLHAMWRAYQFLSAPAMMHMVSRSARPVPAWLARLRWLHTAALQRFWLDSLANWLLVRPTISLARDIQDFDDQVVSRAVGLPNQASAISSLQHGEARKQGTSGSSMTSDVGQAPGVLGHIMESLASALYWFEDRLVLKGGGEGLMTVIDRLGVYANHIERLLSQPRYLLLLIMATFIVIL
jgi:NADH:ubiquinone oxidoreductase subunit 5 (subunit L)/multisubunit Na+/H+ antiporter MnhA subunit